MHRKILAAWAFVLLTSSVSSAAFGAPFTVQFTLEPAGGSITGKPGSLVGWGYSIENQDATSWFVATGISSSSFSLGVPDASYFDFPVIAPLGLASVAFDAASLTGLYGVTIFSGALPGQSDLGQFTLAGEWWTGDPLGTGAYLRDAVAVASSYQLGITAVPVPATPWLLLSAILGLCRFQRTRQKGHQLFAGPG